MDSLRAILQARQTARRDADGGFIRSSAFKRGLGKREIEFEPSLTYTEWVDGIDVSLWQAAINWQTVQNNNIKFAIIRAGSATSVTGECYEDTQFRRNAEQAPDYMVGVGYYWYFKPAAHAIKQAEYFMNLIRDKRWHIWPVVDVEETGGKDKRGVASAVWVFCDQVRRGLGECMIYTSPGFWNSYVYPGNWAHTYPLWNAHWNVNKPVVPLDWSRFGVEETLWQCRVSQDGKAMGVGSNGLDRNKFAGTLSDFKAKFKISDGGQPPAPVLTHEQQHNILWREAQRAGWNVGV